MLSDAPTAYAMALEWALLPTPEQREGAGRRLADLVRGSTFRISTGLVGTPLMTDALTAAGHADLAYRLLLATGSPSWLFPVTMGAYNTDVRPLLADLRADMGLDPDPVAAYRRSGYPEQIRAARQGGQQAGWGA